MQAVDGHYLYTVGGAIRPLEKLNASTLWTDAWLPLYIASAELERFIQQSVFTPAIINSRENANALLALLKELSTEATKEDNKEKLIDAYEVYRLTKAVTAFEAVLSAEFRLAPLFLVTPKRGYNLATLVYAGESLFPADLAIKVPAAAFDLRYGARCLAFELFTAAAFHWHRATESVLRKYWEVVLPKRAHPGNKTLGDYLTALRISRKGSTKLKAALRDIKDLYRNPVIHPEYQVADVDEAIALLNSIHTAVVLMLKAMPDPPAPKA